MTKENSKKLYDHYVKVGNTKGMENMLKKYPDFKEDQEVKEAPKKEKSKKTKD